MSRHWLVLAVMLSAGCATSFTGSAFVKDGRKGCEQLCATGGLEMSALVYMGEYSNACVCSKPGRGNSSAANASAIEGGAIGIVMQTQPDLSQQR